jgi:RHS repeat-associated protein
MKKNILLTALFSIFLLSNVRSQNILFENMGTPTATTSINAATFQNNGTLTFSNGAQTNSADIRNTSPSSGYASASGGGNVYFTSISGTYGFSIEGINASFYTSLSIQFGYRKEAATSLASLSVDYWNGTSWIPIANTAQVLFNESASTTAGWYLSKSISLPADAQINGLKLRFVKTGTVAIRIDDIKLSGFEILPNITTTTVSSVTNNSATFGGNVTATNGATITATGTVYSVTATNANPTLGGTGVTTLSTASPSATTGTFSNSSGTLLSPNIQYSYNAYATKSTGTTGYSTVSTFYTLAVTPTAPVISNITATKLNITLGSDSNAVTTTYVIREITTGKYLQTDGTLSSLALYHTKSAWSTTTVTGLNASTSYSFSVMAKNGDAINTSFSPLSTVTTLQTPTITTSGTLSALSTTYGTASGFTSFSLSATNLTSSIVITPPNGFELSQTTGGTSGYSNTITLNPTSGTVSATTIYVRLAATTGYGSYSGTISLSSANDGITTTVATVLSTVSKLTASISGITIANKTYDGTTTATIVGIPVVTGLLAGDSTTTTIDSSGVTANFADAAVGTAKPVAVLGYGLNGVAANNYLVTQPSGLTADITANASSDVVFNSSSSTSSNSNIDYKSYQGTTLTSTTTSINGSTGVMGFHLRDGGAGLNDADNLDTELTDITFNVTNGANIRSARLFVGTSARGVPVAVNGASTITFSGLTNIIASDNSQLAINLRITFNSTVTDNQQMQFTIASVTAKATGSQFAAANGGGAASSISGDVNRIEVTADRLAFMQQPSTVYAQSNMSPAPSVEAKDVNGNRDLDFSDAVAITSTGTLNTTPVSANALNGVAVFNNINHSVDGTGLVLSASATGMTSIASNLFDINALIMPTFNAVAPICWGSTLSSLPTTSLQGITGTWSPTLNNTATTTYTFTPNAGQNASVTNLTITVNFSVIPTFNNVPPAERGTVLNPLPTVSLEGIIGSWLPSLNNLATTTYTFTPTTPCSSPTNLTIIITDPDQSSSGGGSNPGGNTPGQEYYHDTQGKLEISNSGQATYTLPIALPPSISNVGPTINLVYLSGQNSGIAGQGWNINSISYINRISTRQDIDGFKDGVDFDDNDKLALDGQRLLLKTGNYWDDSSTYETEVQSNLKIELKGSGNSIYFIVTSPDGSRTWYGNYGGMNATDLSAYYIVRFEDANGNFILYNYSKPYNKSLCIDTIQFSANTNSNTLPLNYIKFNYSNAIRSEEAYFKGVLVEKAELLNKIKVYTNGNLFKEYRLTHDSDPELGYQKVTQIQEFNGSGEASNPVVFKYDTTSSGITQLSPTLDTSFADDKDINSGVKYSGDFNGDGRLDLVYDNMLYMKNVQSSSFYQLTLPFSIDSRKTILGTMGQQYQSIINTTENIGSLEFRILSILPSQFNSFSTTKTIAFDNSTSYDSNLNVINYGDGSTEYGSLVNGCDSSASIKGSNEYIEGDFNGDGISEVLVYKTINERYYYIESFDQDSHPLITPCTKSFINDGKECYLVDLNNNSSNVLGQNGYLQLSNSILLQGDKKIVNDYNGDGKSDVLVINNDGSYKVVGFRQLLTTPWIELELLGQGTIDKYSTTKQTLFGDFNGDSKIDIIIPEASVDGCEDDVNCNLWYIYYGVPNLNGISFSVKNTFSITAYMPKREDYINSKFYNSYYAIDVNKDGKTDLVRFETREEYQSSFSDWSESWRVHTFINNIGNNNSTSGFINDLVTPFNGATRPGSTTPFFGSMKFNSGNSDFMIFYHFPCENYCSIPNQFSKGCSYYSFDKNHIRDYSLTKVTQSNGAIVDNIVYSPLTSGSSNSGQGLPTDFYSTTNSLSYPYSILRNSPIIRLVSVIQNTTLGIHKYRLFKYQDFVANQNLGVIGFTKFMQSNWYANDPNSLVVGKYICDVTENDPLMKNTIKKQFSVMLNQDELFNFQTNYTNKINQTEYTFTQSTDPVTKRYTILLQNQKTTSFLTNVIKETIYNTYDNYNLPTKVTNNNYLGTTLQGSTITETSYDAPTVSGIASNYFIGRPHQIITTKTAYSDIKKFSQTLIYTNGNVTEIDKNVYQNDNVTLDPVTLVETMSYFPNGLLKDKIISATGTSSTNAVTPRKTSYTYDPTNRFVSTVTDPELLVSTNVSFHPIYGVVLESKNPFNQTVTSVYDNWGKRISVNDDDLGVKTSYNYSRASNIYTTAVTKTTTAGVSDGSSSIIDQDVLSHEIRKGNKNINGDWTYVNTEYDVYGRKFRTSEPYFGSGSPSQWTLYGYDDYSRPISTTSYTGKVVTNTYNGLTVTAQDTTMSKTKTLDSNGFVISATDNPGGTITYQYDANGNLLLSNYDGITSSISYDNWGRKTQLIDSSAGTYTYSYNAYSEIKTEGTPKGLTIYTYDGLSGRVLTRKVYALLADNISPDTSNTLSNTKIETTYDYNAATKLLDSISVINPNDGNSLFSYTYDPKRRLYKTEETIGDVSTPTAVFTKILSFDAFSRIDNETNTASAYNKTSTKVIKHNYSTNNGDLIGIKDDVTQNVLWQTNTINARGQVVNVVMGNGIAVTNTYDNFGYTSQNKHLLGTTNIMTLNDEFDPILGNLNNRYNSLFDNKESFAYDNLDRLISWDGLSTNLLLLPFDTTTDGFTFSGTSTQGSVSNVASSLKVLLKNTSVYVNKDFNISGTVGDKYRIKGDIINKAVTGNAIVDIVIIETDPDNASNYFEFPIGTVENGTFDIDYIVSDNLPNAKLSLKFIIEEAPSNIGSGGTIIPTTTFYLDNFKVDKITVNNQNYDDRGRITDNNIGHYRYDPTLHPYQNTSILTTGDATAYYNSRPQQDIDYNAFKAPVKIEEQGFDTVYFGYNPFEKRSVMYYGNTSVDKLSKPYRKYYSADGSMEIKAIFAPSDTSTPTSVEFMTYIGGDAYTAAAVLKSDGTTQNYFYLHRDYQGSILAITNETGNVIEKRLFDPWGGIEIIQDGAGNTLTQLTFFDRGYTGHEHIQSVGLINMNARLYDPKLHRFLQADNFIQDINNTQNYNRYGYCLNNPLKYSDLDGNNPLIFIGVGVALLSYFTVTAINHGHITVDGVTNAIFWGFMSSAVSFGVGEATSTISSFVLKATTESLLHGATQGGIASLQGGKFWNSFAAGSISSLAASSWTGGGQWHGIGGGFAQSTIGTIAFGTISGGAGSYLTGGNFWQGAVTGLIVSGLNHALHNDDEDDGIGQDKTTSEATKIDKKPFVLNESKRTIYYKPEKTSEALPLGPGQKTYDPIDGINVGGKVYKVPDGYDSVTIKANFKVYIRYDNLLYLAVGIYKGGVVVRSDFKKDDHGWDNLFNIKK